MQPHPYNRHQLQQQRGGGIANASLDNKTQFLTRAGLHLLCEPTAEDNWISRQMATCEEGGYKDAQTGEPLNREDKASYELYQQRFSERYRVGEQADRLVQIVDRYMPRIADENRAYVMRYPDKVGEMLQKAWKLRKKIRKRQSDAGTAKRTKAGTSEARKHGEQQQERARPSAEELATMRRAAEGTVVPSGRRDASGSEDTPPDWGGDDDDVTAPPKSRSRQRGKRKTSQGGKCRAHGTKTQRTCGGAAAMAQPVGGTEAQRTRRGAWTELPCDKSDR